MRSKPKPSPVLSWLVMGVGIALMVLALSADLLHVDTDLRWGPFRKATFGLGLVALVVPLLGRAIDALDRHILGHPKASELDSRPEWRWNAPWPSLGRVHGRASDRSGAGAGKSVPSHRVSQHETVDRVRISRRKVLDSIVARKMLLALMIAFMVVELLYLGLASAWNWAEWPQTTHYYALLATAFADGETALPIEAPPALSRLPNPYLASAREGIPAITDLSYYRGRYYMYWGPAPAAMLLPWMAMGGQAVDDGVVVLVAVSLIFVFGTLTLVYMRRAYFPSLPGWLLTAGVAIAATSHPMMWSLNRPGIYEGAITSGQAFLIAGVYFALPLMDHSGTQSWRYSLAGALWVLAVGSRLTLLGGVLVLVVGVIAATLIPAGSRRALRPRITSTLAFLFPLVLGFGLLGAYNHVRFGDVLESGFRYQLNPSGDLSVLLAQGRIFSPKYLLPDTLYHFVAPIRLRPEFPFLRAVYGRHPVFSAFLARLKLPEPGLESNVGLLFAMPVVLCVGAVAARLSWLGGVPPGASARMSDAQESCGRERNLNRILAILLLAGLASLAPVLVYWYVSARFLMDAVPVFALLSAVGVWQVYETSQPYPVRGLLARCFIVAVVVLTILAGFLLGLNGAGSTFDEINPEVYESLVGLFSW